MKLYVINDEAKKIATTKNLVKTVHVDEKVIKSWANYMFKPPNFKIIVPYNTKYKADILIFTNYQGNIKQYNFSKEFTWSAGTEHIIKDYSIDDWDYHTKELDAMKIIWKITITQLPCTYTTTITNPSIPSYNIYQIQDGEALPYKAIIKVGGVSYNLVYNTSLLGWCA